MIGRRRGRRQLAGEQLAQARQQAHELQIKADAFAAGYLQAQRRASGDEPLGPAAADERLKAAAAYYINQLYRMETGQDA